MGCYTRAPRLKAYDARPSRNLRAIRFGSFVANLRAGELYKDGAQIRLQEQPFKVLTILLARAGEVVTRDELREKLWPKDTFVDFDHGINVAVAKIREALGDCADEPQFVATVGRRGYRFLKAVEFEQDGATSPTTPFTSPRTKRHIVGRQKERTQLRSAFESAAGGHGVLACVAGEPGIGKTTLVEDFLSDLHGGGKRFLLARGRCSERLAGSEGYLPFLEALENLLRNGGDIAAQKLRRLAPSWYLQLIPVFETGTSDAALQGYARSTSQEKMKRELAAFLQDIAREETLVLFFDDLHWADASTVDLLAYLATKFEGTRIMLIGAYRPSELFVSNNPFVGVKRELQLRGTCCEIEVELLSTADVERYIQLEFRHNQFPREFATVIHARTEGNALFVVDLLEYLRDMKVLVKSETGSAWRLGRPVPDLGRALPQSVRSMIEMKIDQIGEREREVLTAAAVQGYEFDSAAVACALEADSVEMEEILDRLERVHAFVKRVAEEELPAGPLTVRCRFVHILYQNALYSSLTPARRAALSLALAHALEHFYADKTAAIAPELGFLYETARDPDRASSYFLLAAQNAAQIFANQEAIALARRGLALLGKIPQSPERTRKELDLQITLAFALLCTVGYAAPETGANMARARELCRQLGDTASLFPTVFGLWTYYLCKGDLKSAREAAEHLSSLSHDLNDPALRLGAHATLGFTLHQQGELLACRQHFEEGFRVYDVAQHNHYVQLYRLDPGLHAQAEMTRTLWLLGFPDQARQKMEESLTLARALSSPLSLAFCQLFAAWLCQQLHQPEKIIEIGAACIALCEEQAIQLERAWVMCPYGWAIAEVGRVEEGLSHIRAGLDTQLSIGAQVARTQGLANFVEALWHAGRTQEAFAAVEEGLAVSNRNGEPFYDAELWRLKGELFKMQGKAADVECCFQKAIEIARQQAAKSLELRASTSLARLWQQQNRSREAQRLLGDIYAWFTEGFDTADLKEASSLLGELS